MDSVGRKEEITKAHWVPVYKEGKWYGEDVAYSLFSELAYKVSRFSEFEEDLKRYPNTYLPDKQILQEVNNVIESLTIK